MKKALKIFVVFLVVLSAGFGVLYASTNEKLPVGEEGEKAEVLAQKMLKSLGQDQYLDTRYLEWSLNNHYYKWDKDSNIVVINWGKNHVVLDTKNPELSIIKSPEGLSNKKKTKLIVKAKNYFNNDSFWLVAPYKIYDEGVERSYVNYKGSDALLITYNVGGTTPGDSFLWILDENGMPIEYKMWVKIIPIGGVKATWSDWKTTSSGAMLPKSHKLFGFKISMGDLKGYN